MIMIIVIIITITIVIIIIIIIIIIIVNINNPVASKYRNDIQLDNHVLRADEALFSFGWPSSSDRVSIKIPVVV